MEEWGSGRMGEWEIRSEGAGLLELGSPILPLPHSPIPPFSHSPILDSSFSILHYQLTSPLCPLNIRVSLAQEFRA